MGMSCRSCGYETHEVFSLGEMPLPNKLLNFPDEGFDTYRLDVDLCRHCQLAEIRTPAPREEMFRDYTFLSSCSPPVVTEAQKLAKRLSRLLKPGEEVLEIASNDGYLLEQYKQLGIPVMGVDPSLAAVRRAAERGIETIPEFFDCDLALHLAKQHPKARIIHAHNVLAHVPDVNDFVEGLRILLPEEGLLVAEVQNLLPQLRRGYWDNFYHEHMSYFTFYALNYLFGAHGLRIFSTEFLGAHGGSLRVYARHGEMMPSPRFDLEVEFVYFRDLVWKFRTRFKELFRGKRVAGFGAAAKTTMLLTYCGLTNRDIMYVVDETPTKIGKYIPGTGIEVRSPKALDRDPPEILCIFIWNYSEEIQKRFPQFKTIVPHSG